MIIYRLLFKRVPVHIDQKAKFASIGRYSTKYKYYYTYNIWLLVTSSTTSNLISLSDITKCINQL